MTLLFLARPAYGPTEPEADAAAKRAVNRDSTLVVHDALFMQSMTCNNCNALLRTCLNAGGYDYFAMQHADVAPEHGWAQTLVDELEKHDFDVIHAPARFKNDRGITSTAIGYSDNIWAPVRRITTKELEKLPQTFDIPILREVYDPDAERMLLNTGCMVFRIGDWLDNFPGFTMVDGFCKRDGVWRSASVSEDYVFGHWCANNGLHVGATKVTTTHWGRKGFSTDDISGEEHDEEYYRDVAALREAVA